jgi:hypothetical protein
MSLKCHILRQADENGGDFVVVRPLFSLLFPVFRTILASAALTFPGRDASFAT